MGLLDRLLEGLLQQQGGAQPAQATGSGGFDKAKLIGLASAIVTLLNDPRIGGIDGLVKRFQDVGLADLIGSWIGTGQNQPIEPGQLDQVFPQEMAQVLEQAGLPLEQGGAILAQILPQLIDQLTPGGQVPERDQLSQAGADLLKGLFG